MAICGNSRPASGSEHHMSHFLEMDFVKKHERIPPHGVKVAIGAMVSIDLYNYLKDNNIQFDNCSKVYELASQLPKVETIKKMLVEIGCPICYKEIGVSKETVIDMIKNAYKVRDRFTIMTLYNRLGLLEKIAPIIADKYYENN